VSTIIGILGDLAKETLWIFSHLMDHGSDDFNILVKLRALNMNVHTHKNTIRGVRGDELADRNSLAMLFDECGCHI
jgi:hypothetical protein